MHVLAADLAQHVGVLVLGPDGVDHPEASMCSTGPHRWHPHADTASHRQHERRRLATARRTARPKASAGAARFARSRLTMARIISQTESQHKSRHEQECLA